MGRGGRAGDVRGRVGAPGPALRRVARGDGRPLRGASPVPGRVRRGAPAGGPLAGAARDPRARLRRVPGGGRADGDGHAGRRGGGGQRGAGPRPRIRRDGDLRRPHDPVAAGSGCDAGRQRGHDSAWAGDGRRDVTCPSTVLPLNVPNVLTLVRIVAVPVLVVALLGAIPGGDALAAAVFALAAVTDGLDGYIARSRGSVTTFGKLMDPLADKLLIVAALVSLVSLDRLEAWVAMVIISRELAVTGLRSIAAERGVVISASWLGKAKTELQVAAVLALIAVI